MNEMAHALRGALEAAHFARSTPGPVSQTLPTLTTNNAKELLTQEPSTFLAVALSQASKLEEPPTTYLAKNGDVVPLRQDPIQASEDLIDEARRRIAAINTVLGIRAAPKD